MRRGMAALLGTVAGTALLVGVKVAATPAGTAAADGASVGTGGTGAGGSCRTGTGNAEPVVPPGAGTVTVTVKVCGGTVSTASGTLSQSNWDRNTPAMPQLNTLAVQYAKSDVSKIHYSGATLTSNAYQASLRAALAKAV